MQKGVLVTALMVTPLTWQELAGPSPPLWLSEYTKDRPQSSSCLLVSRSCGPSAEVNQNLLRTESEKFLSFVLFLKFQSPG